MLGSVVMPSNRSEALNTSRPRKMMKEAACATNFMKGLRRIFPSCNTTEQGSRRWDGGEDMEEKEERGQREGGRGDVLENTSSSSL